MNILQGKLGRFLACQLQKVFGEIDADYLTFCSNHLSCWNGRRSTTTTNVEHSLTFAQPEPPTCSLSEIIPKAERLRVVGIRSCVIGTSCFCVGFFFRHSAS